MKIAVVGCGAVGSFYGAKLCRAGLDAHFLLRSDYAVVKERGVSIRSFQGDFKVHPQCAQRPEEIGVSDLVLIGLKTTANEQFTRLLPPLVGPNTALLTLQNGLGNEEALARVFPARQILGGLCFVCLNRVEPGMVRHLAHGRVVIGEFQRPPERRTYQFADRLRAADVPCDVTDDLARAHWEKLVWNIPFNGLGVAGVAGPLALQDGRVPAETIPGRCLATDELLADPRWEECVRGLMLEVIHAAGAQGFDLADGLAEVNINRTRTMGAYKASTLLDFERGLPLELESLFLEPWRQARRAGASTPLLQNLCAVLTQLDTLRRAPT